MIKVGALCIRTCAVTKQEVLCQIVSLYDKRDIDYECPESVAIIGMVRLVYINEEQLGYESSVSRRSLSTNWEVVNDA